MRLLQRREPGKGAFESLTTAPPAPRAAPDLTREARRPGAVCLWILATTRCILPTIGSLGHDMDAWTVPGIEGWRQFVRALAIFVGSALGVAVSGIAVILWAQDGGDFNRVDHPLIVGAGALLVGFLVFVSEALIVAIVAVRRRQLVEWLAGYSGVMVGIVPYWIMFERANGSGAYLANAPIGLFVLAAPTAGLVFVVVGLVRLALGPSTPPEPAGPPPA
jgi:hypothetical protein